MTEKLVVMREGLCSLHVCCEKGLSDKQIEDLAPSTSIKSRWKIHKESPDQVRVECADDPGREHLVMTC